MNKEQKIKAEKLLDMNTKYTIKVFQPVKEGGALSSTGEMVQVQHVGVEGCGMLAFYYTHKINRAGNELPIATRAKYPDGTRPDRCQPIICGSCKKEIKLMCDMRWEGEL